MNKKTTINYILKFKDLSKFLVVGGVGTIIDLFIYMSLCRLLNVTLSKFISTTIACIVSLLFNKKWTFKYKGNINLSLILRYFLSQIANIICNVTINTITYNFTKMRILAFVVATGCAMIINFALQRFYVFNTKEDSKR